MRAAHVTESSDPLSRGASWALGEKDEPWGEIRLLGLGSWDAEGRGGRRFEILAGPVAFGEPILVLLAPGLREPGLRASFRYGRGTAMPIGRSISLPKLRLPRSESRLGWSQAPPARSIVLAVALLFPPLPSLLASPVDILLYSVYSCILLSFEIHSRSRSLLTTFLGHHAHYSPQASQSAASIASCLQSNTLRLATQPGRIYLPHI